MAFVTVCAEMMAGNPAVIAAPIAPPAPFRKLRRSVFGGSPCTGSPFMRSSRFVSKCYFTMRSFTPAHSGSFRTADSLRSNIPFLGQRDQLADLPLAALPRLRIGGLRIDHGRDQKDGIGSPELGVAQAGAHPLHALFDHRRIGRR